MLCPRCNNHDAQIHPQFGVCVCEYCELEESTFDKPSKYPEFTRDSIREGRREYKKDILQPFREGALSKEYLEEYGTTGIEVSQHQIDNARYTQKETAGWWQRNRSKGGLKKIPEVKPKI